MKLHDNLISVPWYKLKDKKMIEYLFAEFKQTMQTNNSTSQGQVTFRCKIH